MRAHAHTRACACYVTYTLLSCGCDVFRLLISPWPICQKTRRVSPIISV